MTRGKAINKKEHCPDNRRDHSKPSAAGPSGNEALPNVEDTSDPEKLAGDQRHEHDDVRQKIGAVDNTPTEPQSANDNQREGDHALTSFGDSDHRRIFVQEPQL